MYPKLVTYLCFMLMQQLRAFGYALNGIVLFFWKERHAKIHAVAALFIITLSFYLHITSSEWLWVLLCITLVIVSEMINTAIERLCNKLTIELDPDIKIINEWPNEALTKVNIDHNTALIALTHDPKIDDPAIQYALKVKCFYIGALGSKKTHENRCERLEKAGFSREITSQIHGPIGIKLGGRSAPEIALSVVSQLVSEVYKRK